MAVKKRGNFERHNRIPKKDIDILGYNRLIMKVMSQLAKKHGRWVYDYREELEQEGIIGLIKAYHTYDPNRGTYVTIAYLKIHTEMTRCINRRARTFVHMNQLEDINPPGAEGRGKLTWEDLFPGNLVDYFSVARLSINPEEEKLWKLFEGLCNGVLKPPMYLYVGVTKEELVGLTKELRERMASVVLELYGESYLYN